jgi:hypothetical protein
MDLSWIAYLIAAVIAGVVLYFTFGRARANANRGDGPVEPPR